jgi:hypothetical protein
MCHYHIYINVYIKCNCQNVCLSHDSQRMCIFITLHTHSLPGVLIIIMYSYVIALYIGSSACMKKTCLPPNYFIQKMYICMYIYQHLHMFMYSCINVHIYVYIHIYIHTGSSIHEETALSSTADFSIYFSRLVATPAHLWGLQAYMCMYTCASINAYDLSV